MKGWTRLFCVTALLYNFVLGWGNEIRLALDYWNNISTVSPGLKTTGLLVLAALYMFILAHSVRLILFFESSRRIQILLSGSMPFVRVVSAYLLIAPQKKSMLSVPILLAITLMTIIDLVPLALLLPTKVRQVFAATEEKRREKFWAKKAGFRTDL